MNKKIAMAIILCCFVIGIPGITIPGEFESSVTKKQNDVFIVTLTEYRKAEDFRDSEKKEGTLSAYWKYEVTPPEIKFLEQGGDMSPELIG